jgi:Ca-activated chloride channel family protein
MKILVFFISALLINTAYAQSGRVKPTSEKEKSKQIHIETPKSDKRNPSTYSEDEVIKVSSVLITIPVSVTDKGSKPILDLTAEDFVLEINGKPAQISGFSPAEKVPTRIALLIDNSASIASAWDFEKQAAISFLYQTLRSEKDMIAIFSIASKPTLEQPLTNNISILKKAIENLREPKGATALFDGIVSASEYLRNTDGRRVIVIVSDGEDNLSDATLEDAIRSVQISNCIVYVVKTSDFENFKRTGNRASNANTTFLIADKRMQILASQTGGNVYSPIDELEMKNFFTQIANEISQQYILIYYAEGENSIPGNSYSINVKIKNNSNLIVRSRKTYFIPRN